MMMFVLGFVIKPLYIEGYHFGVLDIVLIFNIYRILCKLKPRKISCFTRSDFREH